MLTFWTRTSRLQCLERGVLVSRTVYMPDTAARTAATLRLHVTAAMSKSDVAHAVGVLQEAADAVIAGERSAAAPARGRGRQRATTTRRRKSTAAAAVSTPAQRSVRALRPCNDALRAVAHALDQFARRRPLAAAPHASAPRNRRMPRHRAKLKS